MEFENELKNQWDASMELLEVQEKAEDRIEALEDRVLQLEEKVENMKQENNKLRYYNTQITTELNNVIHFLNSRYDNIV